MERRGGQRPGAGRKKGSINQNKVALEQIKDSINKQEIMAPIEILMEVAHISYSAATVTLRKDGRFDKDMFQLATDAASKAAPYLHAKLVESKTEVTSIKRIDEWTDEELACMANNSTTSDDK